MIAALAHAAKPVSTAELSGSETSAAPGDAGASFQDALNAVAHVDVRHGNDEQPPSKPERRARPNAQAGSQAPALPHQPPASPLAMALSVPPPPQPMQRAAQAGQVDLGQVDLTAPSGIESQRGEPQRLNAPAWQARDLSQTVTAQGFQAQAGERASSQATPQQGTTTAPENAASAQSAGNRAPAESGAAAEPATAFSQPLSAADSGAAMKALAARGLAMPFAAPLSSDPAQDCVADELAEPAAAQPMQTSPVSPAGSAIALSSQMALFAAAQAGRPDNAGKIPSTTPTPDSADRNLSHPAHADAKGGGSAQGQAGADQTNAVAHHSDSGGASQDASAQQQPAAAAPVAAAAKATSDASAAAHFNVQAAGSSAPSAPSSATSANPGSATDRQAAAQTLPAAAQPAPPAINTAQLIHTMQDSQMRVGIHSAEFGNISISTSATRDAVSAQISLEHPELAKAIADSIPQIRETLGPNQNLEIRIAMNAQSGSTLNHNPGGSGSGSHDAWGSSRATRAGPASASAIQGQPLSAEPGVLLHTNTDTSRLDVRI